MCVCVCVDFVVKMNRTQCHLRKLSLRESCRCGVAQVGRCARGPDRTRTLERFRREPRGRTARHSKRKMPGALMMKILNTHSGYLPRIRSEEGEAGGLRGRREYNDTWAWVEVGARRARHSRSVQASDRVRCHAQLRKLIDVAQHWTAKLRGGMLPPEAYAARKPRPDQHTTRARTTPRVDPDISLVWRPVHNGVGSLATQRVCSNSRALELSAFHNRYSVYSS